MCIIFIVHFHLKKFTVKKVLDAIIVIAQYARDQVVVSARDQALA